MYYRYKRKQKVNAYSQRVIFDNNTGTMHIIGLNDCPQAVLQQHIPQKMSVKSNSSIPIINTTDTNSTYEDLDAYSHTYPNEMGQDEHFKCPAYSTLDLTSISSHQSVIKRQSLSPVSSPSHSHTHKFPVHRTPSDEDDGMPCSSPQVSPRDLQSIPSPLPLSPHGRSNSLSTLALHKATSLEHHMLSPKVTAHRSTGPTLPPRNTSPRLVLSQLPINHTPVNKSISQDGSFMPHLTLPSQAIRRVSSGDQSISSTLLHQHKKGAVYKTSSYDPPSDPSPYLTPKFSKLKYSEKTLAHMTNESPILYPAALNPDPTPTVIVLQRLPDLDQASPYSSPVSINAAHDIPYPYSTPALLLQNHGLPLAQRRRSYNTSLSSESSTESDETYHPNPYSTPISVKSIQPDSAHQVLANIEEGGAQNQLEQDGGHNVENTSPSNTTAALQDDEPSQITPKPREGAEEALSDANAGHTQSTKRLRLIVKQSRIHSDSEPSSNAVQQ